MTNKSNGSINWGSLVGIPNAKQAQKVLEMANVVAQHANARRGDPKPRRRQPTGRPARAARRRGGPLNMPNNALYQDRNGKTDFSGATTKQLQQSAWKRNPATSDLMAPRGLGFYDAFNTSSESAVTTMTVGPATAINARTTIPTISTSHSSNADAIWTSRDAQLLIIGPARGATQAVVWKITSAVDTAPAQRTEYNSPQLESDAPIDAIPVRCSVRIRNFTNNYNVGGVVRVLRATTGRTMMPGLYSNGELEDLMEGIRNHARTTVMTGPEFQVSQQKNTVVCDQTRSLQFESFGKPYKLAPSRLLHDFAGTNFDPGTVGAVHATHEGTSGNPTYDDFGGSYQGGDVNTEGPGPVVANQPNHTGAGNWTNSNTHPDSFQNMFVDPFTDYCANPTFTPIFVLFEPCVSQISPNYTGVPSLVPSALGNQYEIRIASQFLAHYRQGSMLANMAREHKSSLDRVQKAKEQEDKFGSMFHPAVSSLVEGAKTAFSLYNML